MRRGLRYPALLGALAIAAGVSGGVAYIRAWKLASSSTADLMARALQEPGNAEVQAQLGRRLLEENHPDEAAQAFAAAFAAKPQRRDYGAMAIESLVRAGLRGQAATAADAYLQRYGADPVLLEAAGSAYYAAGNLEAAVREFRRSVEQAPSNARGWAGLALALADQHNLRDALAAANRALALDPGAEEARVALAHVLDLSGDTARAVQLLHKAVQQDPHDVRAWEFLCSAAVRLRGGEDPGTDGLLQEAERAAPHSAVVAYWRGVYWMQGRRYAQAAACFRAALAMNPIYPDALYNLSLAYAFQGDGQASAVVRRRFVLLSGYLRAMTELQIRLSRDPRRPELWRQMLVSARRHGDELREEYARIHLAGLESQGRGQPGGSRASVGNRKVHDTRFHGDQAEGPP